MSKQHIDKLQGIYNRASAAYGESIDAMDDEHYNRELFALLPERRSAFVVARDALIAATDDEMRQ